MSQTDFWDPIAVTEKTDVNLVQAANSFYEEYEVDYTKTLSVETIALDTY